MNRTYLRHGIKHEYSISKHHRKSCSMRPFLCCLFFRTWPHLFTTADATCHFSVSNPSRTSVSASTVSIHVGRQKGSYSFYSRHFRAATSHYSSRSVCWLLLCETSQVYITINTQVSDVFSRSCKWLSSGSFFL